MNQGGSLVQMKHQNHGQTRAVGLIACDRKLSEPLSPLLGQQYATPHCMRQWICPSSSNLTARADRNQDVQHGWSAMSMESLQASLQAVSHV